MSYKFSNTNGVIGKKLDTTSAGDTVASSGVFTMADCYERRLEATWPEPDLRYNPRFHNATTNPGAALTKDMQTDAKTLAYPSTFHPGGVSSLTGFAFSDFGNDLFDPHFGHFTIYIPSSSTSIQIPFTTKNQADGEANMTTETFTGGGKTFQIKHGFPDVGLWAFRLINQTDTTTAFHLLFNGAIGSDAASHNRMTTVNATLNSPSETFKIHFFQNSSMDAGDVDETNFVASDGNEMFQIAVIPMRALDYGTGTDTTQILTNTPTTFSSSRGEMDPQHFKTIALTVGLTFYITKGNNLTNTANYIAADLNRESAS